MSLPGFNIPNLTPRALAAVDRALARIGMHTFKNPIHSKYLEQELGLTGPEIRGIICHLRLQEYPIGSRGTGYYYATPDQLRETIGHMKGRAFKIGQVAGALEATLKKMIKGTQGKLFELEKGK